MSAEVILALILKFMGAAAGAALALVFVPPKTLQGFFRRLFVSLVSALTFSTYVRDYFGFSKDAEGVIGAAGLTAFASWWALGTGLRILRALEHSRLERDRDIDGQTD